jgi:hypothetical protein
MKHGLAVLALVLAGAVHSAEPAAAPPANAPVAEANPAAVKPAARKPLDLRVGDIRNYMMPNEYRAAISAPDADQNTVVVEGARELLPMKSLKPVPAGFPPATLWWALRNPAQSWRILVPDPRAAPPGPPSVVPPPVFRWGP